MKTLADLQMNVLMAARDNGISSILFRNALAKKLGINLTESLCLTLLGTKEVSTPTEIAQYIGLTTGATTTLLDRLEQKKFIRRKANPQDRRGILIEINESYAQTAGKLVQGIQAAHTKLISQYSESELELIADFLNRFTENVVENTNKIEAI